jgi:hypothetical protein
MENAGELRWSTIQYAAPVEDVRYFILRPWGERAGDKWCGSVCFGVQGMSCKSARCITDDVSKETAIAACEGHWFGRSITANPDRDDASGPHDNLCEHRRDGCR